MVEVLNRPVGKFFTSAGNVLRGREVTILCDCARGRAMHERQGGDGTTSGKMPVFDPSTMELADVAREKPRPMDSQYVMD